MLRTWQARSTTRIQLVKFRPAAGPCSYEVALSAYHAAVQKGENERRWPTVWLPRPGSKNRQGCPTTAGLSGGWRGFAIDQVLDQSSAMSRGPPDLRHPLL